MPSLTVEDVQAQTESVVDLARIIVPKIEKKWDCIIDVDRKVLQEAAMRALITLDHLGIEQPNNFKQAGHIGFWIRKLKPLRFVNLKSFQEMFCSLRDSDLIKGHMEDVPVKEPGYRTNYVNETFAVLAAIGHVSAAAQGTPHMPKHVFNDLVTNLRYHSFSPSAFATILEARMPQI